MYRLLFDLVLRRLPPEKAHELAFDLIRAVAAVPGLRALVHLFFPTPAAGAVELWGRRFPSRLGVAAGFDKDARCVTGLTMLGFGYVEIGTITAHGQPGNEAPRMWRMVEQRALRNRMGFNNAGSAVAAERLQRLRATRAGRAAVVGVNIGKTKVTAPEDAPADYATSAGRLAPYADYLVVNVSSPNTPGLRDLQAVSSLRPILEATRAAADEATDRAGRPRVPLLVKIAPDLSDEDVDAVADLALELGLEGVVAVNTTIAHDLGPGGVSGPPLLSRGLDVVARLRGRLGPEPVIIGVGGITTPSDAREYLAVGATLVQGYTAFIYQGPFWASRIARGLASDAGRTSATGVA
ncbi:quinone-dependent dihydroorotate dehydrogenase [Cellulomonas soli]|uniref:Dihydroorotate dehydrogenase (quinone) n=1 Tax=Cellulomonas soli TaxID=931535 RepID=A0A512P9N6_9CELL|nr:quinone-dependent dihydroorotate dehydrogenase [Cellulomonas soli]NYI60405.1 dihydroorotate dehydrogenase [Cellulomonas soli]GEP67918.1 dihydroorotate dehydrogenase (quinone) [Cellulomonas soli]